MRERVFEVPADLMVEFAGSLEEQEMDNAMEGVTDEGDIRVRVWYEPGQKQVLYAFHDRIDEYNENREDEEGEDEDDDEG